MQSKLGSNPLEFAAIGHRSHQLTKQITNKLHPNQNKQVDD